MKNNPAIGSPDSFSPILKPQKTRYAVCLCTDRRMLIPALFVADSVKSHSGASDNCFEIMIFAEPSEVTDVHRRWMEQRNIMLCDDMDMTHLRGVGKIQGRLSPATLMKLSLAEHLAGQYDKILYLDCDLTIHEDVTPIFCLDTAPFALAAVPSGRILVALSERERQETEDHWQALGMSKPYRFFNTGVLFIDVERWNRENIGAQTLDFIRQNFDLCTLPDEHGLNAVLDGKIAQLSSLWNTFPLPRWRKVPFGFTSPVIIHHAGLVKPWRRFCWGKELFSDLAVYRLYEDFLRNSPWPTWLKEQWGWRDFYLNIKGEIGRTVRRLNGTLEEPTAKQRREYYEAVQRYYAKERFTDVEQGIAIRENGKIRLKTRVPGR